MTRLIDDLRATVPDVANVVAAPSLPFQFAGAEVMGRSSMVRYEDSEPVGALFQAVTDEYFDSLGIELLEGRLIVGADAELDPLPVVLDETLARALAGSESVLGRTIDLLRSFRALVVGVVDDVRFAALERESVRTLYLPWAALGPEMWFVTIGIRTDSPIDVVAPLARRAVWAQDPNLPVPDLSTMTRRISRSVASERYLTSLFVGFALIAGFMAAGGLYGTLLYTARQRQREMGIRVAIGAERSDLVRIVLVEGTVLAIVGIAAGLAVVWIGGNVLESYVFGIAPRDPVTIGVVALATGTLAVMVSMIPAVRASSVDPMSVLRLD